MPNLIQLDIVERNGSPIVASYGFDTSEIASPIRFDSINNVSVFTTDILKGVNISNGSIGKVEYKSSNTLASIKLQAYSLVLLTVIRRRTSSIDNEQMLFNSEKIAENLVPTLNGCKFLYIEEGDPLTVEYEVSDSVASIIAQTAISGGGGGISLAQNGLRINSSYVELGQTIGQVGDPARLLRDTEIPLSTFELYFTGVNNTIGFSESNGFTVSDDTSLSNIYFRVNANNVNGAGILESLPTLSYIPGVSSGDTLVAINAAGEFYNTEIDPLNPLDYYREDNVNSPNVSPINNGTFGVVLGDSSSITAGAFGYVLGYNSTSNNDNQVIFGNSNSLTPSTGNSNVAFGNFLEVGGISTSVLLYGSDVNVTGTQASRNSAILGYDVVATGIYDSALLANNTDITGTALTNSALTSYGSTINSSSGIVGSISGSTVSISVDSGYFGHGLNSTGVDNGYLIGKNLTSTHDGSMLIGYGLTSSAINRIEIGLNNTDKWSIDSTNRFFNTSLGTSALSVIGKTALDSINAYTSGSDIAFQVSDDRNTSIYGILNLGTAPGGTIKTQNGLLVLTNLLGDTMSLTCGPTFSSIYTSQGASGAMLMNTPIRNDSGQRHFIYSNSPGGLSLNGGTFFSDDINISTAGRVSVGGLTAGTSTFNIYGSLGLKYSRSSSGVNVDISNTYYYYTNNTPSNYDIVDTLASCYGRVFYLCSEDTGVLTLQPQAGDQFLFNGVVTSTFTVNAYEKYKFHNNGAYWVAYKYN